LSILPDWRIRELCQEGLLPKKPMIDPFEDRQVRDGKISYGLSSYGYDIRVADEFKVFDEQTFHYCDPKQFYHESFRDIKAAACIIPPNSFLLARSFEYMRIPRSVMAICVGKSTYARCGIIVNVTPLEPEWEGFITLEISNTAPRPATIYANEGICQIVFFERQYAEGLCEVSYKDRAGKYQAQQGIELPKI